MAEFRACAIHAGAAGDLDVIAAGSACDRHGGGAGLCDLEIARRCMDEDIETILFHAATIQALLPIFKH